MKYTKLMVEVFRRAVDGEFVILSVAKGQTNKPIPLWVDDPWAGTEAEAGTYVLGWSVPSVASREEEVLRISNNDTVAAGHLSQICEAAEELVFDATAADRWPYKVVFTEADLSWTQAYQSH